MTRPAIFLDRDGVINRCAIREGKPHPPTCLQEMKILAGVRIALSALKQAGYFLIVVTNQPDVARGITSKTVVDGMNNWLKSKLPLDAIFTCFHDDIDQCNCRKPKPGMLLAAAVELKLDLSASFMIGDRWRDIEAGQRAGCKTVFIDYGYDEKQPESVDFKTRSLVEATEMILKKEE